MPTDLTSQGALEKDASISLTPRFSGVGFGSRSFLTVSTVFPVFAGPFGTFLGAPWAERRASLGIGSSDLARSLAILLHSKETFRERQFPLSEAMVASYRYDPYGNTISSSGSLFAANVYRFSSKEIHVNSGMYYYPINKVDPLGLLPWTEPPWNVPPGDACEAYHCNCALKAACLNAADGGWSNCVRDCLLADWDPVSCSYKSGGVARHL